MPPISRPLRRGGSNVAVLTAVHLSIRIRIHQDQDMGAAVAVQTSARINGVVVSSDCPYIIFDPRRGLLSEHRDATSALNALSQDELAAGSETVVYIAGHDQWIPLARR
jgi:hypothetical protein